MRNNNSSVFKRLTNVSLFLSLLIALVTTNNAKAQSAAEGESLFKQKCSACHAVDRVVIGPALKGVEARRKEEWLIKWIKNSQSLVKAGDADAVKLFKEYNSTVMTAFPELSDDNIKSILAYVKEAANKPAAASTQGGAVQPKEEISNFMVVGLLVVVIISLLVIVVLNKVITTLERLILQKQGIDIAEIDANQSPSFKEKFKIKLKNKKFVFFWTLVMVAIIGGWALNYAWNIGVHQGYQPEQPIKFSHQIHAGVNKIDCRYCHSGAYKSKNASIPSANVCMNCHKYVQATEKYNGEISPEIMKIYKALDYDPQTKKYGDNQKPIQWIRIHNLPDLAYFNHSQHVKVAGVKCQKCHGPIETMKEVYQYAPLTMKWCINCHKQTDVNLKGNAYYDKLLVYHEKLKRGEKVTVATIGGLECGKCHY